MNPIDFSEYQSYYKNAGYVPACILHTQLAPKTDHMKARRKFVFSNVKSLLTIAPDANEDEWEKVRIGKLHPPYPMEYQPGAEGHASYVTSCQDFIAGIERVQQEHHHHAVKIKVRVSDDTTLRGTVISGTFDTKKDVVVLTVKWEELRGSQSALKALPPVYHLPWCIFSRHPAEWKSGQTLCPEDDIYIGPLPLPETLKAAA